MSYFFSGATHIQCRVTYGVIRYPSVCLSVRLLHATIKPVVLKQANHVVTTGCKCGCRMLVFPNERFGRSSNRVTVNGRQIPTGQNKRQQTSVSHKYRHTYKRGHNIKLRPTCHSLQYKLFKTLNFHRYQTHKLLTLTPRSVYHKRHF